MLYPSIFQPREPEVHASMWKFAKVNFFWTSLTHLITDYSEIYTLIKMLYQKQASSALSCPHPPQLSPGATTMKISAIWYGIY